MGATSGKLVMPGNNSAGHPLKVLQVFVPYVIASFQLAPEFWHFRQD